MGANRISYFIGTEVLFPGGWIGCDKAGHWLASSAEVNNECRYTSIPPSMCSDNRTFTIVVFWVSYKFVKE